MWRFSAGNGYLRFVSRNSSNRIEVRAKHWDFSQALSSRPTAEFSRTDYNEIHNVAPDRPLRELTSFDDFGSLSFGRSASMETVSSQETSFLDQILRTDALPKYSGLHIPTTIEAKDLNRLGEVPGYDEAVQLLSEGVDVSRVVEDLRNLASQDLAQPTKIVVDDQQPSTSAAFTVPQQEVDVEPELPFLMPRFEKATKFDIVEDTLPYLIPEISSDPPKRTRRLMTEKMRIQRKAEVAASEPARQMDRIHNVGEMMFPDELPSYQNVPIMKTITTTTPDSVMEETKPQMRSEIVQPEFEEFSLTLLEEMVAEEKFTELLNILAVASWPHHLFSQPGRYDRRINAVLELAVNRAPTIQDATRVLKSFANSHPNACISDRVLLSVVVRVAEEDGIEATLTSVGQMANMCLTRQRKHNRKFVDKTLITVYDRLLAKDTIDNCSVVLSNCMSNKFDNSADTFMRSAARSARAKKSDFFETLKSWSELSRQHGSTSGMDQMWMLAIEATSSKTEGTSVQKKVRGSKKVVGMAKRFEVLLNYCQTSDHPFSSIANMIVAFVRTGNLAAAEEIFNKVSVSGRYFIQPLTLAAQENDLISIENFADLVTKCMIPERIKGKRAKTTEAAEKVSHLEEGVMEMIESFCGVGGRRKKYTTLGKKEKRKIHRIDQEQLHTLTSELQVLWAKCAVAHNSPQSVEKLKKWIEVNRIDEEETVPKVLKRLESKPSE